MKHSAYIRTLMSFFKHMDRVFARLPTPPSDSDIKTYNAYRLAKQEFKKLYENYNLLAETDNDRTDSANP